MNKSFFVYSRNPCEREKLSVVTFMHTRSYALIRMYKLLDMDKGEVFVRLICPTFY